MQISLMLQINVICHNHKHVVWYGVVMCGVAWCFFHGVVACGVTWHGVECCGVWCGVAASQCTVKHVGKCTYCLYLCSCECECRCASLFICFVQSAPCVCVCECVHTCLYVVTLLFMLGYMSAWVHDHIHAGMDMCAHPHICRHAHTWP